MYGIRKLNKKSRNDIVPKIIKREMREKIETFYKEKIVC